MNKQSKMFSKGLIVGIFAIFAMAAYVPFSVTSGANKQRVERAKIDINCNSSVTVSSQSGSWMSGCTCNGTGDATCSFSGFSAAPTCTAMGKGAVYINLSGVSIATSSIRLRSKSDAGVDTNDTEVNLICMGPR